MSREIAMLKRLFGPTPEDLLLDEIRKSLTPLGFSESKDFTYPFLDFKHEAFLVRWIKDYKDQMYVFCICVGTESIERPDGTIFESPKQVINIYCSLSDKDLNEFKNKVLKTLDDWLKTI